MRKTLQVLLVAFC
jgi:hypothetical protein